MNEKKYVGERPSNETREELKKFLGQSIMVRGKWNKNRQRNALGKELTLFTDVEVLCDPSIKLTHIWIPYTTRLESINNGDYVVFNASVFKYQKKTTICGVTVMKDSYGLKRIKYIESSETNKHLAS